MPEPSWPEGYGPPPDDWEWRLVDVTCDECGKTNQLHEQPPEWLKNPAGVRWECNHCGAVHRLGGTDPVAPALYVLECGNCSNTYDPNKIEVADDGSWVCKGTVTAADGTETEVGCGTSNRDVTAGETGAGTTTQTVAR